jgi:penicillin-binding protein 2
MIPASRRRLAVVYVVVAALLVSLGGRLWYLQVMTGGSYVSLAAQDQTRDVIVPSVRGEIVDDVGQPLVDNRTALVVSVASTTLSQQADGGAAVLHRLAGLLGMPYRLLSEKIRLCTAGVSQPCWAGSPYQPIPVDQQVSDAVALQIMEDHSEFPGVSAQVLPVVSYPAPTGVDMAQVLGYLQPITPQEVKQRHLPVTGFSGVDLVGQSGLEAQYDQQLRGTAGSQVLSVNAAGQVTGTVSQTPAKPGDNLVTSINAQVQEDTANALSAAIRSAQAQGNTGATSGAAVVMTTTGRIVAMASYPSYNPGVWSGGISQAQFNDMFGTSGGEPILNRVTQGEYAPGSTWKVTSAAAAMADGFSTGGPYSCPGSVTVAGHVFNDWTPQNLGEMSLHQALVMSCDTVFYQIAYQMWLTDNQHADLVANPRAPVQKMQKMELAWGFGTNTGVDLPEESPGTVPTRQWLYNYWAQYKSFWCSNGRQDGSYIQQIEYDNCQSGYVWTPGQAVNASIGQGYVTVTPLQLARAYAALANGGTVYSPRIGSALLSGSGQVVATVKPAVAGHLPVSPGTLAYIRDSLVDVVTQGTAAGAFAGFPLGKLAIAAKTGTAEVAGGQATSVFASFAPAYDPRYVVVVMIPKSGEGADVSAPAARQIWDGIYGLEGHKAAFPGGRAPTALPGVSAAGVITAPAGYRGSS